MDGGRHYAAARVDGRRILLHNYLMAPPPGWEVDHIDHNPLSCTRANMRLVNKHQQARNRRPWGAAGYRGVRRLESGRWQARTMLRRRVHYLGTYATAEEAARAVDAFWREVDAEHAYLAMNTAGGIAEMSELRYEVRTSPMRATPCWSAWWLSTWAW
jgi:hypothetical protein